MNRGRWLRVTGALLLSLAALLVASAPGRLDYRPAVPEISGDVVSWIERREAEVNRKTPLVDNTRKRILWHEGRAGSVTDWAVIYLHGFSATRQEVAPLAERVARGLQANLFETRLAGHGLMKNPLVDVTAEAWLDDAAEALGVGLAIGERVLLMGTSTGATLALTLLDSPQGDRISAVVLLAPNFGPADSNSEFLTWPAGTALARLMIGSHHSWEPANELQERYWATSYPVEALVEMMRLVKRVRGQQPIRTQAALLAVYSPHDTVINTAKLVEGFSQIEAPRKRLLALPDADDPANPGMHVLAGDIMAPHNTAVLADTIIAFVSQAAR